MCIVSFGETLWDDFGYKPLQDGRISFSLYSSALRDYAMWHGLINCAKTVTAGGAESVHAQPLDMMIYLKMFVNCSAKIMVDFIIVSFFYTHTLTSFQPFNSFAKRQISPVPSLVSESSRRALLHTFQAHPSTGMPTAT